MEVVNAYGITVFVIFTSLVFLVSGEWSRSGWECANYGYTSSGS